MRGLYIAEGRVSVRKDLPFPRAGESEALIAVRLAGICHTDLELLRGYYAFEGVPGHEFVGVVRECTDPAWIGHRVVGEINIACGQCDMCLRGMKTHCRQRTTLGLRGRDGALAEFLTLPIENLHRVPADVPDEAAVFVEPLAAALEILEQVSVHPSDSVAVVGDGKLGLLIAQVISLTGCRLIVFGHHPEKLTILDRRRIVTSESIARWRGQMDLVVECTGQPTGLLDAMELLRPRGILVLKSTYAIDPSIPISRAVVNELTLVGSRCGPFEPALRLLARRQIDTHSLIDSVYPLAEGARAIARAGERGSLKVLVQP